MADFDTAIRKVLDHEGGYTPGIEHDPGGETNFGISRRAYPQLDITNLTADEAKAIYLRDYWTPLGGDSIQNQQIANAALDFAVNAGLHAATELLRVRSPNVEAFTVARIRYYAGLKNFSHFAASWVRRSLDY